MKTLLHIKKAYPQALVMVLVFLFLISPCKVRNFIQAELGVPKTNVLNKSQSTLTQSSCVAFDVVEINTSSSKTVDLFVAKEFSSLYLPIVTNTTTKVGISNTRLNIGVPLYILYQNLLVYS